jgi:RNA polymerase sigma-70 factor (ECF subfamily)
MTTSNTEFLPTRESLLNRLRDLGDQDSWQEFVDLYSPLLLGLARRSGLSETEAEDAVQETFIAVAGKLPEFRYDPKVCSFKRWLRVIAERRITDQFRKRPPCGLFHEPHRGDSSSTPPIEKVADPHGADVDAHWDCEFEQTVTEAALGQLKKQVKPTHYQVFYLSEIKRQSGRDVAQALGLSTTSVYVIRHRLARLFKKALARVQTHPG